MSSNTKKPTVAKKPVAAKKEEVKTEVPKAAEKPVVKKVVPVKKDTAKDELKSERSDLAEKIEKLDVALNTKKVPQSEVEILTRQVYAMRKYLQILNERLK